MNETTKKLLNPTETIIQNIPILIEAFVEFYGEENREYITTKFTNLIVIGYSLPNDVDAIIHQSDNQKSEEIKNEFLNKCTKNQEEIEKLKKYFFNDSSLKYDNLHPINKYIEYKENPENRQNEYRKKEIVTFLKQIYKEVTMENLDELLEAGTFKNIDVFIPIYKLERKKYEIFQKEIKPYQDYVDKCDKYKNELEKKYNKILIEQLKFLFTNEEYLEIEESMAKGKFYIWELDGVCKGKVENYLGLCLNSITLLTSFDEESEEILKTEITWKKDSIKKDRIKYFNNLGINLGDNYDDYINNPKVKELIPSQELINQIQDIRKNLYAKMMVEFYNSIPEYKQNRERIDKQNLLEKDDGYEANVFENKLTCTTTNIKLEHGKYVEYPILLMHIDNQNEYLDHFLIHELNHILELNLKNIENNECTYQCGFEILKGNIGLKKEEVSLEKRDEKRNYELFSEIINELIAQEISEIISKKGIYVFNTKDTKKIKGASSYEQTKFLVWKFYETYKKEILEARKTGNIEIIYDTVGKDNFEALNQLFHEYEEKIYPLGPFKLVEIYKNLQSNIDTPDTIMYKELMSKRDVILANMQEYNKTNNKKR